MDHIPEPRNSVPAILVPLVEPIVPYDGTDFPSFGRKLGFLDGEIETMTPTAIASRLQSWLFFGLLSQAVDHFDMADFISQPQDGSFSRFLSLRNLQPGRFKEISEYPGHYGLAMFAMDTITAMDASGRLNESPAGETGLAILVLAQTMAIMTFTPSQYGVSLPKWTSRFLNQHMIDNGWCPQQIAWIMDVSDAIATCFLARLRKTTSVSHTNCTEAACVANNVQLNSTYRQRHVSDGCTCRAISVDAERVKNIIRQGDVPLISFERQSRGEIKLKVSKATARSKYVALSHVWSDGLGNPMANAIPHCQAEMISTSLSDIPTGKSPPGDNLIYGVRVDPGRLPWYKSIRPRNSPVFWLDTLCIPVATPEDSQEVQADVNKLKQMAINQMGRIYAAADRVLVLDSELQQTTIDPSDELSHVEMLARFVSCAWMRRCWTLQEGALAKGIVFQTASGAMTPLLPLLPSSKDYRRMKPLPGPWLYFWAFDMWRKSEREALKRDEAATAATARPVLSHLRYRFQGILTRVTATRQRVRFLGHATPSTQFDMFCTVWNHLSYRNSTMIEDLPAIFANLLDLNAYRILEASTLDRMKVLLRGIDVLPVELLFNTGPRAHAARDCLYRWLPTQPCKAKMPEPYTLESWKTLAYEKLFEDVENSMRWVESGNLEFSPWDSGEFMAIILEGTECRREPFVISVHLPDSDNPATVLVHIQYPEDDEMQRDDNGRGLILLDTRTLANTGPSELRGCSFQLKGAKEDLNRFTCHYDSPLTWTYVAPDDVNEHSQVLERVVVPPFSIRINSGSYSLVEPKELSG